MDSASPVFDLAKVANALGQALSPVDDDHDLVTCIADAARAVFGAVACSVALVTPDGGHVVFTTVSGENQDKVGGLTMPIGEGIVGWVATTGQAVAVGDLANDPRFASGVASQTGYIPTTILASPVETDSRLIGVIEVLDRDETRPNAGADLQLLSLFAKQAALAIDAASRSKRIGDTLLRAFAETLDGDLAAGIERVSGADDDEQDDQLGEVAAAFARLAAGGEAERSLAVDLLNDIGRYSARRR